MRNLALWGAVFAVPLVACSGKDDPALGAGQAGATSAGDHSGGNAPGAGSAGSSNAGNGQAQGGTTNTNQGGTTNTSQGGTDAAGSGGNSGGINGTGGAASCAGTPLVPPTPTVCPAHQDRPPPRSTR